MSSCNLNYLRFIHYILIDICYSVLGHILLYNCFYVLNFYSTSVVIPIMTALASVFPSLHVNSVNLSFCPHWSTCGCQNCRHYPNLILSHLSLTLVTSFTQPCFNRITKYHNLSTILNLTPCSIGTFQTIAFRFHQHTTPVKLCLICSFTDTELHFGWIHPAYDVHSNVTL